MRLFRASLADSLRFNSAAIFNACLYSSRCSEESGLEVIVAELIVILNKMMDFLRDDRRHNLEELLRLVLDDARDHIVAMLNELVMKGLNERLTELIARTFGASRIAGFEPVGGKV